jgi:hypothetical protein
MNFQLNSPALLTAGQILNQQCLASADAARARRNVGQRRAEPEPAAEDLIMAAVADLVSAGQLFRLHNAIEKPMHNGLACAVANIFHLAALKGIDLGAEIASQLQYAVENPDPF